MVIVIKKQEFYYLTYQEATNDKNLFSSEKDEKIKCLMKSIDNTNYRYGRSTISLQVLGFKKDGISKRQHYSK